MFLGVVCKRKKEKEKEMSTELRVLGVVCERE